MLNHATPSIDTRMGRVRGGAQGMESEAIMARNTDVELKDLVARVAKAKGIPAEKMGKQVRSRIRSNIDNGTIVPTKHWPLYAKAAKVNRDGNRYPAMPAATADAIFNSMCKGKALKDSLAKPPRARKAPKADEAPAPTTTDAA